MSKRQNFNITSEQEAEISLLKEIIGASTTKDAILSAVRFYSVVAREVKEGRQVYFAGNKAEQMQRLMIPEIEKLRPFQYKYLVSRPHKWQQQLYVKGRRLPAATVWSDMLNNEMTPEEAAASWDLPLAAVHECIRYSEENQALIDMEAEEESRLLAMKHQN